MAISTYKIFLMQKNTSAWEKLIDIKEFPRPRRCAGNAGNYYSV